MEDHKQDLIKYLKKFNIKNVIDLWAYAKNYYREENIEMGGSYASFGDSISVILFKGTKENREIISFEVKLDEV